MCSRCDGFLERRRINSPHEYRDLVRQILEIVQQGTFRLLSGTCPLGEVLTAKAWPSDHIIHVLACTNCSRRFQLSVETYHGSGGNDILFAFANAVVSECNRDLTTVERHLSPTTASNGEVCIQPSQRPHPSFPVHADRRKDDSEAYLKSFSPFVGPDHTSGHLALIGLAKKLRIEGRKNGP